MSNPPPARGVRAGICQDAKGAKDGVYDPRGAGTAWSHGFLNQKPWHPLSFRNQQRKWEAEQKKLEHEKHVVSAKEEFEREQEHFRSVSYLNPEEQKRFKDKQQIAFMYMKPPGLDAALSKEKEQNQALQGAQTQGKPPQTTPNQQATHYLRPHPTDAGSFDEKGPMALMLKARANYEASHRWEVQKRSPPRGGFGLDAANQQFVIPSAEELTNDGEEQESQKSQRRMKREQRKKMVEDAEAVLQAAGFDVDHISRQFKKAKRHKSSKSKKSKKDKHIGSSAVGNAEDSTDEMDRKKARKRMKKHHVTGDQHLDGG